MKLLDSCYEKCLNGIPKVSPSVEELANDYLKKHRTTEEACRAMLKNQIAKCTTSGVVTGFGGFITMPVAILANVGSVIYVQMRMIACVAYIVSRVLDTITSKERWGYISQYLTDLCEASPESVLRKLEDELKQPQGLLELFEANDGDFMTSRHYYTNVLWAVEQLVQQKKYVVRALEWLWKVDSYNLKYSILIIVLLFRLS